MSDKWEDDHEMRWQTDWTLTKKRKRLTWKRGSLLSLSLEVIVLDSSWLSWETGKYKLCVENPFVHNAFCSKAESSLGREYRELILQSVFFHMQDRSTTREPKKGGGVISGRNIISYDKDALGIQKVLNRSHNNSSIMCEVSSVVSLK